MDRDEILATCILFGLCFSLFMGFSQWWYFGLALGVAFGCSIPAKDSAEDDSGEPKL